jgi:TIR domain
MADRRSHLIFISYRGSDQNWATELVYARMTEAFGTDAVFKAGNTLRAGQEFPAILRSEAASCPVMLACIGPGWLTATAPDGGRRLDSPDDWVREEIATSLQAGNHLVPLLIGNRNEVEVPKPDLVPESIRAMVHRQALWLAPGRGLDATIPVLVDRLIELVPELAERRRVRSAAQPASATQARRRDASPAPAAPGTTMTQRNEVAGSGLLIGAQDGSVFVGTGACAAAATGSRHEQESAGRGARVSIESELATLAGSAAVALVTAMGTNAWTSVRDAVARAFRRAGAKGHERIGDQLDTYASLVASADDQEAERAALQPVWLRKLTELVDAAPECAADLAEVIRLHHEAARPTAGTHLKQQTTVRDYARAFVAQGGSVFAHGDLAGPTVPGSTGRPGLPDDGDCET